MSTEPNERLWRGPAGPRGEQGMGIKRRRAVVYLFVLNLVLTALVAFGLVHYVSAQNAKWCSTLVLLTATPVAAPADPGANPSREQAFVLYSDFRHLRRELGCG
jgi:hypothetical protein